MRVFSFDATMLSANKVKGLVKVDQKTAYRPNGGYIFRFYHREIVHPCEVLSVRALRPPSLPPRLRESTTTSVTSEPVRHGLVSSSPDDGAVNAARFSLEISVA